jgi:hypothetical protein
MFHITKPRCFLVYALAPEGMPASEANQRFNAYIGDRRLPLPLFHDHFIGPPGGLVVFYAATEAERQALAESRRLAGWQVAVHPLVFARSPAGFDDQTAFTLRAYRGLAWEALRQEPAPPTDDAAREADTAAEDSAFGGEGDGAGGAG